MEIIINNEKLKIENGIKLKELVPIFQKNYKYKIICAQVGNSIKDLNYEITKPCEIKFLQVTDHTANRIYINSLIYVTIYAYKELFGKDKDIRIEHSLDKGIYITTDIDLTDEIINNLKEKIKEIVNKDLEIKKITASRRDVMSYYKANNEKSKYELVKYNTNSYVTLYKLDYLYDYFFTKMVPSTSYIEYFDLNKIDERGFILRFPTIYQKEICPYTERKNIFNLFKEHNELGDKIKVTTLAELNKVIEEGRISDLIRMVEVVQSNKLLKIANNINDNIDRVRVVLIAGPSSSGKTTTCNKLCMYLKSFGINPKMLSMDDYFLDMKDRPKDEFGNIDYESFDTIDKNLFDDQIEKLINGEEITIPTFDFISGEKVFKNKMTLEKNDILLIEGIHALNTNLLNNISNEHKIKIYLSPCTELNIDNHNRISTSDSRLLRRIIRDFRTRNCSAEETLSLWNNVRKGEEENIFPYQDNADYAFNTDLVYELGVLKTYGEPILHSVSEDSPYYEDALRLLKFLNNVLPIPSESIPDDSIVREFVGGSCFKV